MIMPFEYYINEGKVKKQTPDLEEASALMKKAIRRIEHIKEQKLGSKDAEFIFEDVYEAIREAGQSLMSIKGYKPLSHEAVIAFLKENYQIDLAKIAKFDRYRKLRNKTIYEAKKISVEDVKEAIEFAGSFVKELKGLINLQ